MRQRWTSACMRSVIKRCFVLSVVLVCTKEMTYLCSKLYKRNIFAKQHLKNEPSPWSKCVRQLSRGFYCAHLLVHCFRGWSWIFFIWPNILSLHIFKLLEGVDLKFLILTMAKAVHQPKMLVVCSWSDRSLNVHSKVNPTPFSLREGHCHHIIAEKWGFEYCT